MLKYLNLAVLLPSAKCYQNFIGSTWEVVWGLITRLFYTHNIVYEIQKERKMVFFPALMLDKASGLAEIPSICCEWYFNPGLSSGRVVCISISRSGPVRYIHLICFPKACFPVKIRTPVLGWCSGGRFAWQRRKRVRVASCVNWGCFLSSLGSGPFLAAVWQALLPALGPGRCTTTWAAAGGYAEMATCSQG